MQFVRVIGPGLHRSLQIIHYLNCEPLFLPLYVGLVLGEKFGEAYGANSARNFE